MKNINIIILRLLMSLLATLLWSGVGTCAKPIKGDTVNAPTGIFANVTDPLYGAKGGNFDDTAAFAKALTSGLPVYVPAGTFKITGTVLLNDTSDQHKQYILIGAGRGLTIIDLSGFDADEYFLNVNVGPGSNPSFYAVHPRLIVSNMTVKGTNSKNAGFITAQAGVTLKNIEFYDMYRGLFTIGFTRHISLDEINWVKPRVNPRSNSWTFLQDSLGNGVELRNLQSCYVKLIGCMGAVIEGAICGHYEFSGCNSINFIGNHLEGAFEGTPGFDSLVKITDSSVTLINNFLYNRISGVYPVLINDTGENGKKSEVTMIGNVFYTEISSATTMRQLADIRINGWSTWSYGRLRLINNTWRTRNDVPFGIYASSDDSSLDTVLKQYQNLLPGDVLVTVNGTSWQVSPPDQAIIQFPWIEAPTWGAPQLDFGPSNLSVGTTYYYTSCEFNEISCTDKSTEVSKEATAVLPAIVLRYHSRNRVPTMLRVWRGTSSRSYDRYIEIPLVLAAAELRDRGDYIEGLPWIDSNVPAP
jgi:hypothetical protein